MVFSVKIFLFYLPLVILTIILGLICKKIKWYFWLIAIFAGLLAIIPSTILQFFVPDFLLFNMYSDNYSLFLLSVLLKSFVLNGLIEEFFRSVSSMVLLPKKHSLKEFLFLSAVYGLSFASFENVAYIISGMQNPEIRMITSSIIHVLCALMTGLFIWSCFDGKAHIKPIIMSVIIHTLYNFFASLPEKFWLFSLVVIAFGIFQVIIFAQSYIVKDDEA